MRAFPSKNRLFQLQGFSIKVSWAFLWETFQENTIPSSILLRWRFKRWNCESNLLICWQWAHDIKSTVHLRKESINNFEVNLHTPHRCTFEYPNGPTFAVLLWTVPTIYNLLKRQRSVFMQGWQCCNLRSYHWKLKVRYLCFFFFKFFIFICISWL